MASKSAVQGEGLREDLIISPEGSSLSNVLSSILPGETYKWNKLFSDEVKEVLSMNSKAFFQSSEASLQRVFIARWVADSAQLVKDHTFIYYCADAMEASFFQLAVSHCVKKGAGSLLETSGNLRGVLEFEHEDGSHVRVETFVLEKERLRGTGFKTKSCTVIISDPEFADPECVRAVADSYKERRDVGFVAFGELHDETKGFSCLGDIMQGESVDVLSLDNGDEEGSGVEEQTGK